MRHYNYYIYHYCLYYYCLSVVVVVNNIMILEECFRRSTTITTTTKRSRPINNNIGINVNAFTITPVRHRNNYNNNRLCRSYLFDATSRLVNDNNNNIQVQSYHQNAVLVPYHRSKDLKLYSSLFPHSTTIRLFTSTTTTALPMSNKLEGGGYTSSDLQDSNLNTVTINNTNNPILINLNENQINAVTQPLNGITRLVAGPGSGKTRVLISRIAWLLQEDRYCRILGVTFTKKAATEMQHRLTSLLSLSSQSRTTSTSSSSSSTEQQEEQHNYKRDLDRVSLGTFHSICAKILRWNGDLLCQLPSVIQVMAVQRQEDQSTTSTTTTTTNNNVAVLNKAFNIIDQDEQIRIIKELLKNNNINIADQNLRPIDILNEISSVRNNIIMNGISFSELFSSDTTNKYLSEKQKIVYRLYYKYRYTLLYNNNIDFDDIIYYTRELLSINTNVREKIQQRYTHILVDEYQDTSTSQMDLIKLITNTGTSTSSNNANANSSTRNGGSLLIVGDADQSIYSWRGAHASSMSNFVIDFTNLGSITTIYLMENYRSTANIVRAAQKVIAGSGKVSGSSELRKKMVPQRPKGPTPRIIACADGKEEARYVVKIIKDKLNAGLIGPKDTIAFIYRTNVQSRSLEEACVIHNVPFRLFGSSTSFYKRQEIKDCLCYLRWLYNGRDRTSMIRAIKTPKRNIGDVAIAEFDQYCTIIDTYYYHNTRSQQPDEPPPTPLEVLYLIAGDDSWSSTLEIKNSKFPIPSDTLSSRSLRSFKVFAIQMQKIRKFATHATVEALLGYIINEVELIQHFDNISKTKTEFHEREDNVRELRIAAKRYDPDGPCLIEGSSNEQQQQDGQQQEQDMVFNDDTGLSPLGKFLDDVTLVSDSVEEDTESENKFVVNLMTIHGSKGMEFDAVYFVGLEDGTIPTSQALGEGENSITFEEEKRLCYVAMTRAKTELVMTWRREVMVFTSVGIKTFKRDRSRFLDVLTDQKGTGTDNTKNNGNILSPASKLNNLMQAGTISSTNKSYSTFIGNENRSFRPISPSKNSVDVTKSKVLHTNSRMGESYSSLPSAFENQRQVSKSASTTTSKRSTSTLSKQPRKTSTVTARQSPSTPLPMGTRGTLISKENMEMSRKAHVLNQEVHRRNFARRVEGSDGTVDSRPAITKVDTTTRGVTTRSTSRSQVSTKKSTTPAKVDSTWFFPVGSRVTHKKLGTGVVLHPKSNDNVDSIMLVHIGFPNGEKHEFPLNGSDLSPIVQ